MVSMKNIYVIDENLNQYKDGQWSHKIRRNLQEDVQSEKRSDLGQNLEERHYLRGRERRPKAKKEDIEKIVVRS